MTCDIKQHISVPSRQSMTFNTGSMGFSFGIGSGSGGDPYAPQGSEISKFLSTSTNASSAPEKPATAFSFSLTPPAEKTAPPKVEPAPQVEAPQPVKEEKIVINKSKYAHPNEKRKLFPEVKIEGVNFSKILKNY